MKKLSILFIMIVLLTGCSLNGSNDESNSNTNTNTNTNTQQETGIEYDKNEVGKHKVTLYLFHSNTCGHCQALQAWLNTIKDDYKYLEIVKYEVSENYEFYEEVRNKMGITEQGVPLVIIGNDYVVGYAEYIQNTFTDYFKKNSTYETCDVVSTIKNKGDYQACMKKNK